MLIVVTLLTVLVFFHHGATAAVVCFIAGGVIVRAVSQWLGKGVMRLQWSRSHSTNLVATRGTPTVWLVAHLDSKSQTIPMLMRIASIVMALLLSALFLGVLLRNLVFPSIGGPGVVIVSGALVLALLPLLLCFTGNLSPGAVDNASGVVSVLLAARALQSRADLGVIITSGEELALAGARAFVQSHVTRGIALNCDTVDDDGDFRCMVRGKRGRLAAASERASAKLGFEVPITAIITGILADSIAFSDAGWDSVTLSRGNIATLARVHTSSDNLDRLNGTGIAKAARLLVATVEELS